MPYDRNVSCELTRPGSARRSPGRPAAVRPAGRRPRCRTADRWVRRPAHRARAGPARRCGGRLRGRGRRLSQAATSQPRAACRRLHDVVGRTRRRVAGGQPVTAAAERAGDRGEVDRLGPHRHRPVLRLDLLEHRRDLGLLSGAHDVDDALDFLGPGIRPFLVPTTAYTSPRPPAASGSSCADAEHPRQHRQPRERMGVQQRAADRGVVDAELDQPGGQPVRAGAGPAERTGVGGQPGVQAVRDTASIGLSQASSSSATSIVVESADGST